MARTDRDSITLKVVIDCIGDESGLVEKAFRASESFQSLCQDYEMCKEALQRWQFSESELAGQRHEEYKVLLGELDLEIQTWLKKFTADRAGSAE